MNEIIAIIPARGGSKRVPRKNILLLAGKPLIAYSIEQSLSSKKIDRTIVSTDDPKIAKISKQYGAEVPFLRPKHLAQDITPDLPVFIHALKWLETNENYTPNFIVHLRPTSPFRTTKDIGNAIEKLIEDTDADSIRGVCKPSQNPYKMWTINGRYLKSLLECNIEDAYNSPSQILPLTYWQNGHLDVIKYETIMKKNSMTGKNILPYIMKEEYAIDIDSKFDFDLAEIIMKEGEKK